MLNCHEASRRISLSMDQKLTWSEKIGLFFHVAMCKYCSRFRRQLQILRDLSRRSETISYDFPPTQGLPPEATERIKKQLRTLTD